jgi:uncharacterized protein YjbI with pentapeptide repeats
MSYLDEIRAAHDDPERLEGLYQAAQQEDKSAEFTAGLSACYGQAPDNLLYAAWHYRLRQAVGAPERRSVNWRAAVPLAIVLSLVFWVLSLRKLSLNFADGTPYLLQIWALLAGMAVIAFLTITIRSRSWRIAGVLVALLAFGAYALLFSILPSDRNYQTLAAVHLPVLAWIGVGVVALERRADYANRFAFLIKSIELFVVGGIYAIGGGIFMALTNGLFQTIDVRIPEEIQNLMAPGGLGLIILLATASTYDPLVEAAAQNFRHGLSKLVATLMRLLMPLTLLVLVVFGYFILQPANFWIPFNNRDALITYNAMLFAVVLLLVGAVPVRAADLAPKVQSALRKGVIAVAILTVLISLYALSATLYRTYLGVITMNRLTVIGWNIINIGLLSLLIVRLVRPGQNGWVAAAQAAFSQGMVAYIGWTICVILAVPHIFGQGLATGWSRPAQPAAAPAALSPSQPTAAPAPVEPRPMVTPTPSAQPPPGTPAALAKLPPGCPPACTSAALAGAYLHEAALRGADLSDADLRGADLSQADLRQAKLGGADLRGADLGGANLAAASLRGAEIDETTKMDDKWRIAWQIVNQGGAQRDFGNQPLDLAQADLSGANLRGANLASVSLREADLSGADLSGATLSGVSLHRAIVDGRTQLDGKWRLVWEIVNQGAAGRDLSGVNLSQADLSQADLSHANLSRAVLTDTNLSGATLYGADLRGAILTEPDPQTGAPHQAALDRADLAGVQLDDTTRLEAKWRLVWELVNRSAKARALSGADLTGADLHAIDLSGASLADARLDGADLRGTNLGGADLNGAWLQGVDLTGATLAGANLYEAQLAGARLPADLGGVNLRKTIMNGANLWRFKLGGLNLSRAELRGANLAEADLHAADLSEAHLEGAYLWRADLRGANLRGAYLDKAYLWGANLEGADLTGAELHQTIMPDGAVHE